MPWSAGAIVSKLVLDRKQFTASIKGAEKETKSLTKFVEKNSMQFEKMGKAMTIAGGAIIGALGLMVKRASDAQETTAKFGTVFESVMSDANKSLKNLVHGYGLSEHAAKDMLSATGDLLTGLGMQRDTALDLSTKTQQLAVDLASFTNFSGGAKGASEALTKAMLGERESVKSLGIVITEEMVKERLLTAGKEKLTGQALLQAKAEATLAIATEQSKNAIGDYARTSGSLANVTRLLTARLSDLWEEIGSKLIPMATSLAEKATNLVVRIKEWSEAHPKLISRLTKLTAVFGGLNLILGPMVFMLPKIISGFKYIKVALKAMTGPAGWAAAAIAGIGISIKNLVDTHKEAIDKIKRLNKEILAEAVTGEQFAVLWAKAIEAGGEAFKQWEELMTRFQGHYTKTIHAILTEPKYEELKAILASILVGQTRLNAVGKKLTETNIKQAASAITLAEANARVAAVADRLWERQREQLDISDELIESRSESSIIEKEASDQYQQDLLNLVFAMGQVNQAEIDAQAAAIESAEARAKAMSTIYGAAKGLLGKLAIRSKAAALALAIINTAEAVTKALAAAPPPFNLVLAAISAAAGATEIATIQSQAVPTFQEGGRITERGGIVGEAGPELFVPERPGIIVPLRETRGGRVLPRVEINFSPVFNISTLDPMTTRDVVRQQIMPAMVEALKNKIQLSQLQSALGVY